MRLRVVLLAFCMFVLGVIAHRNQYIPSQVRGLEARLKAFGVHPDVVLAGQYSRNSESLTGVRDVDTALLPLQVRRSRLSDVLPAPKTGGAIAAIGNKVIVLDRLGNLYLALPAGKRFSRLAFPPLPNNVTDYLRTPDALLDENRFRAYDIEYIHSAKLLVVSHEAFDRRIGKSRLTVSAIGVDEQTLSPTSSWTTLFQADPEVDGPNVEAGGRLTSKDGHLYLTIGGYDIKSEKILDDPGCDFGTIVELDLGTHANRILSRGHRNAQGLVITATGQILSTEHGPSGGDELNLIREGADYGWPNVTLGTDYGTYSWRAAPVGKHRGYQSPMFAWVPSVGLSNLIQVSGFDPRWDGDLLVASLKAVSLFRLRFEQNRVMYVEPIWIGQRIRDITQLENGTIAMWTDDTQLLYITVDRTRLDQNVRPNKQANSTMNDACMYCHHFGPTNTSDFAPTLSGLFDRRIASDNYRYSGGLRSKEGAWTEEALRQFLRNPAEFANGTAMPRPNLDEEHLEEVIAGLRQNSESDRDNSRVLSRRIARSSER